MQSSNEAGPKGSSLQPTAQILNCLGVIVGWEVA